MRVTLSLVFSFAVFLFSGGSASAQRDYEPTLTFEDAARSGARAGWGGGPGATLVLDSVTVHGGRYAGRIQRDTASEGQFSTYTLSLPVNFSGKVLELRGWLRTEKVTGFAGLWLREDGAAGRVQFDNMQRRQLSGTTDWTEYRISLPLDERAQTIFLGVLLSGQGTVWADDLELLVDGKAAKEAPPNTRVSDAVRADHEFDEGSRIATRALSPEQISHLALLGKVWGFLKYHHPRVTRGELNWDYELFRVMPAVLTSRNRTGVQRVLTDWIGRLGRIERCRSCATISGDLHLTPEIAWIRNVDLLGPGLSNRLDLIYDNRSYEGEQYYVAHAPRVGNPIFSRESFYADLASPDAGFRLLALFRFWNIIEYWFPYRDVIGSDWDQVLKEFIPRVTAADGKEAYQIEMLQLVTRIHDTHANLWRQLSVRPPRGPAQLPVVLRMIEGRVVVTGFSHPRLGPATGFRVGDVIESLDDKPVDSLIAVWRPYYSASNEPTRLRDMARSLTRGDLTPVRASGTRGANRFELVAQRAPISELDLRAGQTHDLPGEAFQMLADDVAYLKLSSVVSARIPDYIQRASGAQVLVIDARNYPSEFVVFKLGGHLVSEPTEFARFTRADGGHPGAFRWTDPVVLQPLQPHFPGKVVVLVDETTQSQAEYTAMALRAAPKTIVVGSTTAGADGNVSPIPLPGGIEAMLSGIGVFYPDRRATQRVGIVPDVQVLPTVDGILEGRDEVLEIGVSRALGREFRLPRR